jgi:hypothetical protein
VVISVFVCLRGSEVTFCDFNSSVSSCSKVQNCLYDDQGFEFPVVTVRVGLCLLDLAMPTAEICHNLYCTLMITKLN